jgi:hypothetical protein
MPLNWSLGNAFGGKGTAPEFSYTMLHNNKQFDMANYINLIIHMNIIIPNLVRIKKVTSFRCNGKELIVESLLFISLPNLHWIYRNSCNTIHKKKCLCNILS